MQDEERVLRELAAPPEESEAAPEQSPTLSAKKGKQGLVDPNAGSSWSVSGFGGDDAASGQRAAPLRRGSGHGGGANAGAGSMVAAQLASPRGVSWDPSAGSNGGIHRAQRGSLMGAEPDSANGLLHALLPRGGGGSARAPLLDLDWAAAGAVDLTGRGGGGGAGAGAGGGGAATELDSMFDQLMQEQRSLKAELRQSQTSVMTSSAAFRRGMGQTTGPDHSWRHSTVSPFGFRPNGTQRRRRVAATAPSSYARPGRRRGGGTQYGGFAGFQTLNQSMAGGPHEVVAGRRVRRTFDDHLAPPAMHATNPAHSGGFPALDSRDGGRPGPADQHPPRPERREQERLGDSVSSGRFLDDDQTTDYLSSIRGSDNRSPVARSPLA